MTNYDGLWEGFLLLFAIAPAVIGAGIGLAWGWRRGWRRAKLVATTLLSAGAGVLLVFTGALLIFRA